MFDQGLLKECYLESFDSYRYFFKNNNVSEKTGFECGEFRCLPIESFCDNKTDFRYFHPERICPGLHFLNFN